MKISSIISHTETQPLRDRISEDVFDYQSLLGALREYGNPRNKITSLLQSGDVLRVKKGIYVFSERLRKGPIVREAISNMIYGPSYVSREYALAYYGLIPELVPVVTAMTTGLKKRFQTPLGTFTYAHLDAHSYFTGVTMKTTDTESFLIAAPEKALIDAAHNAAGLQLRSTRDVERYLFEDMRIDPDELHAFRPAVLREIAARPSSRRVAFLLSYLLRIIEGTRR